MPCGMTEEVFVQHLLLFALRRSGELRFFLLSPGFWETLFAKGLGTIDYQFERLWAK